MWDQPVSPYLLAPLNTQAILDEMNIGNVKILKNEILYVIHTDMHTYTLHAQVQRA